MTDNTSSCAAWSGRNVLVTGASGFIGRWLTRALAAGGARVTALSRSATHPDTARGVSTVEGAVEDRALIARIMHEHEIDSVFHLAAVNQNLQPNSAWDLFETNTRGVYSVLDAVREAPRVRSVVVASSRESSGTDRANYAGGNRPKRFPYQASKIAAEAIAQAYHDTFGVPLTIARCGNVYGGGDTNWNRLIPGTVKAILAGQAPVLRSDGKLTRDYAYIEDIVRAYLLLGNALDVPGVRGEALNLCSGQRYSTIQIVSKIGAIAGRPDLAPIITHGSREELIEEPLSPEITSRLIGWHELTPLDEGLRRTVESYRHLSATNRV